MRKLLILITLCLPACGGVGTGYAEDYRASARGCER